MARRIQSDVGPDGPHLGQNRNSASDQERNPGPDFLDKEESLPLKVPCETVAPPRGSWTLTQGPGPPLTAERPGPPGPPNSAAGERRCSIQLAGGRPTEDMRVGPRPPAQGAS